MCWGVPWHTPSLPTDPAKARHTQGTCVEGPCKHPALAKSDRPEARLFPLLEDLHAAIPVPWVPATCVTAAPIPSNHAVVIVAIDLGRKFPQMNQHQSFPMRVTCRIQRTRWGDEEENQGPLRQRSVFHIEMMIIVTIIP